MPTYTFRCEAGHEHDEFVLHTDNKGCQTHVCRTCRSSMAPVITYGQGLLYFEEGRERMIWNLGPEPVFVKSHQEHKRRMRLAGVDFANRGVGYPGQWI